MEKLIAAHLNLLSKHKPTFSRDFANKIAWEEQLIGLKGARGVGKSMLLLQYIKDTYGNTPASLYVSMDNLYFSTHTLLGLAEEFVQKGGKHLFVDEVHKYANWSQELKNIYDTLPELKVVFTGSSVLHIHQGSADLSRRAVVYNMEGLSFREFLEIETRQTFAAYSLKEILAHHRDIAIEVVAKVKPMAYFNQYLQYGFYPYYLQGKGTYSSKLMNTINLVLETDIPYLNNVDLRYVSKLKKLLYILATSVPFQPNVSKLAASIETSRNTVMIYLDYLKDGKLISLLRSPEKTYELMSKPEKVYLHNTNLMYAIAANDPEKGNLRETFFYNQLSAGHEVNSAPKGDFLINKKYVFEVGGENKGFEQLKDVANAYVAADNIEYGYGNKIPLWLFGFLY